ncbi:MAG TPA: DinB family protein, partial [Acidimicrobiia bacterium]
GLRGLDAADLARPCGPAEGPWSQHPMAGLVLHVNREAIHHLAEVALLRDLWRARAVS